MIDTETLMQEAFNLAIVEELLMEINPALVTEETIQKVWQECKGNPWNAGVLGRIMGLI